MRKRSASVTLGDVMAAAILAACGKSVPDPDYNEICIDKETNKRLDDDDCRRGRAGSTFFYMPYAHAVPPVGGAVDTSKGSTVRPSTGRIATVSRAGFGGRAGGGSGS